jgi:hypothetical protein
MSHRNSANMQTLACRMAISSHFIRSIFPTVYSPSLRLYSDHAEDQNALLRDADGTLNLLH